MFFYLFFFNIYFFFWVKLNFIYLSIFTNIDIVAISILHKYLFYYRIIITWAFVSKTVPFFITYANFMNNWIALINFRILNYLPAITWLFITLVRTCGAVITYIDVYVGVNVYNILFTSTFAELTFTYTYSLKFRKSVPWLFMLY